MKHHFRNFNGNGETYILHPCYFRMQLYNIALFGAQISALEGFYSWLQHRCLRYMAMNCSATGAGRSLRSPVRSQYGKQGYMILLLHLYEWQLPFRRLYSLGNSLWTNKIYVSMIFVWIKSLASRQCLLGLAQHTPRLTHNHARASLQLWHIFRQAKFFPGMNMPLCH